MCSSDLSSFPHPSAAHALIFSSPSAARILSSPSLPTPPPLPASCAAAPRSHGLHRSGGEQGQLRRAATRSQPHNDAVFTARRCDDPDAPGGKRSAAWLLAGHAAFTVELQGKPGRRRARRTAAGCCDWERTEAEPYARCFLLQRRRPSPEEGEEHGRRRQAGAEGQVSSVCDFV